MNDLHSLFAAAILSTAVFSGCCPAVDSPKEAVLVPLNSIQLTSGPLYQRQKTNNHYIVYTIKPDRMLAPFMLQAGLAPKAQRYDGWEDGQLSGHSMGHYLSALAYVYNISRDDAERAEAKKKADYVVSELAMIQAKDPDGYTMPMPKETYTRLRQNDVKPQPFNLNGIWSPFYTYHKVLAGLRDVYRFMGNKQALNVEKKLADFVISCVTPLTEENIQRMLSCEFGGMQEVLADLTVDTGERKYLDTAIKYFYHKALMDPLLAKNDILTGRHSNTMIPEMTGMSRIYEILYDKKSEKRYGEKADKYREIPEFFFDRVVNYRSYATGGNSEGEYFFQLDDEAHHITSHTTESCNSYNMAKLASFIFEWDPKAPVEDFVERITLNHIASVISADNEGQYGYFQPLASVANKDFSAAEHTWTCCVGTGLENPARYGEHICAIEDDDELYLNQFWDAKVELKSLRTNMEISGGFPYAKTANVKFSMMLPKSFELKIRKPYWSQTVNLKVNGKPVNAETDDDGYLTIERIWKNGDTVAIDFDFRLRVSPVSKKPNVPVCIMYGPFVMAGIVPDTAANREARRMARDNRSYEIEPSLLFGSEADIVSRLKPAGTFAHFKSEGLIVPHDLEFIPLMEIYRQRYAVYFSEQKNLLPTDTEIAQRTIDEINPGYQQSEIDHKGVYNDTQVVTADNGARSRFAPKGDWFQYTLANVPNQNLLLIVRFQGRRSFLNMTINGKPVLDEDVNGRESSTRMIKITPNMRDAQGNLILKFQGNANLPSPNIQKIILCKEK